MFKVVDPMFQVMTKLKKLKRALKILNREQFSDIEQQAEIAKKTMLDIQEKIHDDIGLMQ